MKKGTTTTIILIVILIIILIICGILWYMNNLQRRKLKTLSVQKLSPDPIVILIKDFENSKQENLSDKILEKKKWFDIYAPTYSKDLNEIAILYKEGLNETAIFKTAKLLENFLKFKYSSSPQFINWKQIEYPKSKGRPNFERYLEYALSINDVSIDEYNFIMGIKSIRNQEAHQIDVKYGLNMCNAALYTFLHIVDNFEQRKLLSV